MRSFLVSLSIISLAACTMSEDVAAQAVQAETIIGEEEFSVEEMGSFDEPWAMAFLPDGRLLITRKSGSLILWSADQPMVEVTGLPDVDYGGQGGLGDIVLHPDFRENGLVYFSYAEAGEGNRRGVVIARGMLVVAGDASTSLNDVEIIWRQLPKTSRRGHFGHRIAFGPDGYLFISSGDRQEQQPAQDPSNTLGSVIRLTDEGDIPDDNPFVGQAGFAPEIWSYGHRNPLGLAFSPDGRLWELEHGPKGGDEINLIEPGENYGWPAVSNGDHYNRRAIPDHDTDPAMRAPGIWWTPVIAPGDMIIYTGAAFPDWQGDILATGMLTRGLVRVAITDDGLREVARYDMGQAIRAVAQAADGAIWMLEDSRGDRGGRLLRMSPSE